MTVITLGASTCYCSFLMISFGWGFSTEWLKLKASHVSHRLSPWPSEKKRCRNRHCRTQCCQADISLSVSLLKRCRVPNCDLWLCVAAELLFQVACEHHLRIILPFKLPCIIKLVPNVTPSFDHALQLMWHHYFDIKQYHPHPKQI